MTRGEIYRTREARPECGGKPGFYVVVPRAFVAENDDVSTVVCAPVEGLPRTSAVRCDFLTLMFKNRLTQFVATLSPEKTGELNRALAIALDLAADSRSRRAI